jgi:ADP-heptose:LPS heptosyltransferase
MGMHTLERQAEQLALAGIWPDAPTAPGAASSPDVAWLAAQAAPLELEAEDLVLLVPGAAPSRPAKRWPAARYGELARRLIEEGLSVAVVGSAAEMVLAAEILAAATDAIDLTGRTDLAQLAALGGRARLAVGNDTGPMHLIAAAGAPSLVLFSGDSDPVITAPRGRVTVLREADLAMLQVDRVVAAALAASRQGGAVA